MSLATNIVSLLLIGFSFLLPPGVDKIALSVGMFAFSGALTNALAVHMLFEKVPLLYGSGVIPRRFEAFKSAIFDLVMAQFFTKEHLQRFLQKATEGEQLDLRKLLEHLDLNPAFDGLVEVIMHSQYGGMINMIGGAAALENLREPFIEKLHGHVAAITTSDSFKAAISEHLSPHGDHDALVDAISGVVSGRLDELTPQMVNTLVKQLIKEHLGWLVLWGGVFGGLIGLLMGFISK